MRRAGPREGVIVFGVDLIALAQDERRSQGRGTTAQALGQSGTAGLPNVSQPAMPSRVGLRPVPGQRRWIVDRESQANPLAAQEIAVIELARIERPGDP